MEERRRKDMRRISKLGIRLPFLSLQVPSDLLLRGRTRGEQMLSHDSETQRKRTVIFLQILEKCNSRQMAEKNITHQCVESILVKVL